MMLTHAPGTDAAIPQIADNEPMRVPMLDLTAHHEPIRGELVSALESALATGRFILGPVVEKFEGRIADYCGAKHAIGVSSGTDALLVSLMALGIGHGDEVITSPYSFFATAGAIARLGARPVFVDIEPVAFNINPEELEAAFTPRTKAVLPVHLFGQCADMKPVLATSVRHGVPVIEDAAQALGAQYRDGRRAGTMGTLGCFSFFPSKNLGALGDAGAVVTNDADLAARVRRLRAHGAAKKYHHDEVGGNFRIDAIHAGFLDVKLNHLAEWSAARRKHADRYDALFAERGLLNPAALVAPRRMWKDSGHTDYHIFNQYVIRTPRRDELMAHLASKEVACEVYYPVPFHLQGCFSGLGYKAGAFPAAESAAKESLAIPVHPDLSEAQQVFVADSIAQFFHAQ